MKTNRPWNLGMFLFFGISTLGILLPLAGILWEALGGTVGLEGQGLETFQLLFRHKDYGRWYTKTLVLCTLNVLITLPLCLWTAWVLDRSRQETRRMFRKVTYVLQFYPPFLSLTALFVLLERFLLLDSFLGLLLVYQAAQLPYWSWYLRGQLSGIPGSYRETALMEGASPITYLRRIQIPLILPGLGVLVVGSFSLPWFDFMVQSLVLSGENTTLATGLLFWLGEGTAEGTRLFAAGTVTAVFPPLVVYLLLQKTIHRAPASPGG